MFHRWFGVSKITALYPTENSPVCSKGEGRTPGPVPRVCVADCFLPKPLDSCRSLLLLLRVYLLWCVVGLTPFNVTKRNLQMTKQNQTQEKEFEVTNEYIFALGSHVIYWSSKDVSLFVAQQVVADAIADSVVDENGVGATAAGATAAR